MTKYEYRSPDLAGFDVYDDLADVIDALSRRDGFSDTNYPPRIERREVGEWAAFAAGEAPTEPATDEWHWGDSARGDWLAYQPHPYRNANRVGTNECWCGFGPYAEHHRRPGSVPQGGTQ